MIGSLDDPIKDTADAYLRLHLLSHRLVRPNELNLDGIFGLLANVAWTSAGPCPPERVDELRVIERAAGRHLAVYGVDKFPRMTDYVVPAGRADRRRRPGPARRAPGRRHHRDARGLRQLQRRHARHLDGRGSDRRRAWWSATAPTSAAAPPSWAPSPAAARRRSASASAA